MQVSRDGLCTRRGARRQKAAGPWGGFAAFGGSVPAEAYPQPPERHLALRGLKSPDRRDARWWRPPRVAQEVPGHRRQHSIDRLLTHAIERRAPKKVGRPRSTLHED